MILFHAECSNEGGSSMVVADHIETIQASRELAFKTAITVEYSRKVLMASRMSILDSQFAIQRSKMLLQELRAKS